MDMEKGKEQELLGLGRRHTWTPSSETVSQYVET